MVRVDEQVGVMVNHDGQPVAFNWRGRHYLVSSQPVRWYSRRLWWQDLAAAPKGLGAAAVEIEMWRLRASCDAQSAIFELRHSQPDGQWHLQQIQG